MLESTFHRRQLTTRICGALLLCGLLLVLCAGARLARYDSLHRSFRLATTHAYLESNEGLKKLPKTTPPALWQTLAVAVFAAATLQLVSFAFVARVPVPLQRTGPTQYSRPPPVH